MAVWKSASRHPRCASSSRSHCGTVRKNATLAAAISVTAKQKETRVANHAYEAPATCWQKTFLERAPAQKTPPPVDPILGSKIWTPKWGPS